MQGLQQLQKEEPSSVREAGQSRGSRAGAPEETGTGSRTRLERGSQQGRDGPVLGILHIGQAEATKGGAYLGRKEERETGSPHCI